MRSRLHLDWWLSTSGYRIRGSIAVAGLLIGLPTVFVGFGSALWLVVPAFTVYDCYRIANGLDTGE